MMDNKLENGTYSSRLENGFTNPVIVPSSVTSGAVLFAENELFDQVAYEKEVSKNSNKKAQSFTVSNGDTTSISGKEEYDYHRKDSRAALEPDAAMFCSKKTKRWCCNVTIAVSLLIIIGLFTLPVIFYYVDVPENDDYSQSDADALLSLLKRCLSNSTQTTNNDMMSGCYAYTGVCLDHLQMTAAMYGIPTTNGIQVMRNPSVSDHDALVSQFISNPIVTDACERDGLPFLCNYFYLLCNGSSGSTVVISDLEDQCVGASEGSCQSVWELAMNFNLVPDCSNLNTGDSMTAASTATPMPTMMSSTMSSPSNTCHPEFGLRCDVCVPLCKEFTETPEDIQKSIDLLLVIASCLIIIGGVFVILVSIVRREVMFDFPSVLVIYMTLVTMVIGFLNLISYGARDYLYCTSPELPIAYENPSTFCQLSGFLLHAGVVQIMLYWLLHLAHLFFKFVFPFAIRRVDTKNWKRAFHIGEVILINLVSFIAPTYILIASKYYPNGYPSNLCIPDSTLAFYSVLLPITIIIGVGTCLILVMFWRLQMRTESIERNDYKVLNFLKLTVPEVKMLALFCFFLVFGISNLIYYSLYARNYEFLLSLATEYTICQAWGRNDTCESHKDEIQEYRYHGLANTCYFLMAFLTLSNLLFAIHVKQLKVHLRRLSIKASKQLRRWSVKETHTTAAGTSNLPTNESCKRYSTDS